MQLSCCSSPRIVKCAVASQASAANINLVSRSPPSLYFLSASLFQEYSPSRTDAAVLCSDSNSKHAVWFTNSTALYSNLARSLSKVPGVHNDGRSVSVCRLLLVNPLTNFGTVLPAFLHHYSQEISMAPHDSTGILQSRWSR